MKIRVIALLSAITVAGCAGGPDENLENLVVPVKPGNGGVTVIGQPQPTICTNVPAAIWLDDSTPIPSNLWGGKHGVVEARRSLSQGISGYFGIDPDIHQVIWYVVSDADIGLALDSLPGSCHHDAPFHNHTQGQPTIPTLPGSDTQSSGEKPIWTAGACDLLKDLDSNATAIVNMTCHY